MRRIVTYTAVFFIIWLATNLAFVSVVFSMILTYRVFDNRLDPYIFDSKTTRLLLTPFFYFLLLQCVALFGYLINRDYPLSASAPIGLIFLLFLYAHEHYFRKRDKIEVFGATSIRINSSDFASLITATIVTLTIIVVPLITGGITHKSSFVSLATGNVDDATHLALLNDRLQFNRGIIHHADLIKQLRSPAPYPVGWYLANSVVIKAVYPSIKPGSVHSLGAYIITKVFWFFILVFVFVKTSFIFLKVFGKKDRPSSSSMTWLIASASLFAVMFLTDFFLYGFYSFIPQLIAILLLAVSILQINHREKQLDSFYGTLTLLAVLAISGSLTWLLILPAVLLTLLALLLQEWRFVGFSNSNFTKGLRNNIILYFPIYALLGGALFIQYYAFTGDASSVSFMQGILLTGGAPIYSGMLFIFVVVGLALSVSLMRERAELRLNGLLILIGSILSLSLVVYVIQVIHFGQPVYYYFKIMSVAMAIVIPISMAGYALGFERLYDKIHDSTPNVRQPIIWATLVFVLLLVPQLTDSQSFRYWAGVRAVSSQLNESIYQQVGNTSSTQNYWDNQYTLYYIPGEPLQSAIGTGILKASKPGSACFDTVNFSVNIRMSLPFDMNAIKRDCASKYHLTIIADFAVADELNNEVKSAGLDGTITINSSHGL